MKKEITGLVSLKMNALLMVRRCEYFKIGRVTTSELFTMKPKIMALPLLEAVAQIQHPLLQV